jgi:hypothetical protein
MFAPTRDQARQFFFDSWRKYRSNLPLSGLETLALNVMLAHPEYHHLIDDPEHHAGRDYAPADGVINPFLHLSLHLAIEEQLAIDQPPGLVAEYERLRDVLGDEHDAKHALLECLGETLWHAQRNGSAPDATRYIDCLKRRPANMR